MTGPVTGPVTDHVEAPVEATQRSIDVGLRADADSCARTAAQLAALAGACDAAGRLTAQHARLGEEQLGGLSGIVYRHSSTLLASTSERVSRRSGRLAEGLVAYAEEVREVRRQLDEVVAIATPVLTVAGGRVWSPARPPDPGDARLSRAWAAWHDAVGVWRQARQRQETAEEAWLRVLHRPVRFEDGPAEPFPGQGDPAVVLS